MSKVCGIGAKVPRQLIENSKNDLSSINLNKEFSQPGLARVGLIAIEPRLLLDAAGIETADEAAAVAIQAAADWQTPLAPSQAEIDVAAFLSSQEDISDGAGETTASQIAFIDSDVEDIQVIISELPPETEVIVLDNSSDGVEQISAALDSRSNIETIHIFSHGSPGSLSLGNSELTSQSMMDEHQNALLSISDTLTESADILIYGCDFGAGSVGQQSVDLLAQITGADIAASDDLTGAAVLGGDWDLEVQTGELDTAAFAASTYAHVLVTDAQIVGGEAFAQGNFVEMGINAGGTFGATGANTPAGYHGPRSNSDLFGFISNPQDDNWATFDGDFFTPGTPLEGFSVEFNGTAFTNDTNGPVQVAGAVSAVNGSDSLCGDPAASIDWSGAVSGLQVDRTYTIAEDGLFILMETTLTNTTGATMSDVYWSHNVDPDNDQSLSGSYATNNTIISQPGATDDLAIVTASQSDNDGSTVSLVADDARARVTHGGFFNNDPSAIHTGTGLNSAVGSTISADEAISLAFELGDLAPGESVTFFYAYNLEADTSGVFGCLNSLAGPAAADDNVTAPEDGPEVTGNLLADNGNGPDTDPDGFTLTVSEVDGAAASVDNEITLASGALLTVNSDGSYEYDPNGAFENLAAGENGTDSFTYTVDNGNGGTDTATVTISVSGANDAPIAQADDINVSETGTVSGSVLLDNGNGIDSDPDVSDVLAVSSVEGLPANVGTQITLPSGALVTVNSDGSFDYDPNGQFASLNAGEDGTDSFTYTVSDGNGGSDTATVVFTVSGEADAPLLNLDLNNDSGTPGDPSDDGLDDGGYAVTFTENDPAIAIVDSDVSISDAEDDIVELVVTLTNGQIGDTLNFPSTPAGGIGAAVLPATTLIAPGPMTVTFTGTAATTAADWEALLLAITFEPSATDNNNPNTADRNITIEAFDSNFNSTGASETVVTVAAENDPPTLDLDDDNSSGINAGNFQGAFVEEGADAALSSDAIITDLDNSNLEGMTFTLTNGEAGDILNVGALPAGISLVGGAPTELAGPGTITVELTGPASLSDYQVAIAAITFANSSDDPVTGIREITITGNDGADDSPTRTAFVDVQGVNDAPEVIDPLDPGTPPANPDAVIPAQSADDSTAVTPLNASQYFTDPDDATLTYSLGPSAPAWLAIDPVSGVVTGTPPSDASQNSNNGTPGSYDVVMIATDSGNLTAQTTAVFNISNPAPIAQDDALTATENGGSLSGNVITADNGNGADSDPDGDTTLSVSEVGGNALNVGNPTAGSNGGLFTNDASGSLTFADNGDFEYLAAGDTALTTIEYTLSDGQGGTDTASITVTVNGTNDVPELVPANLNSDQLGDDGEAITPINTAAAFSDPDGTDVLTYSASGLPAGLMINPTTGVITGTIDSSASQNGNTGSPTDGVYTIIVTADDGNGGTVSDSFTLTASNPAPIAQDDALTTAEDTTDTGNNVLLDNGSSADSDPDGDAPLTISEVGGNAGNVGLPTAGSNGGLFTINTDGSLSFDPNNEFETLAFGQTATTTITYQISDGEGGVSSASVTYTVNGANDGPVVIDPNDPFPNPNDPPVPSDPDNVIPDVSGDDGVPISPTNVSPYFVDVDGDALTFGFDPLDPYVPAWLVIDPASGVISGTPPSNASSGGPNNDGVYPITITAEDPSGLIVTTTLDITISNIAPTAQDDEVLHGEDGTGAGNVLADNGNGPDQDTAPDNDLVTVSAVDGSAVNLGNPTAGANGGLFTINSDGSYDFDPGTDFQDLDAGDTRDTSITYTIDDGNGGEDSATITVTVQGANDGPVIIDPNDPFPNPNDPPVPGDPSDVIPIQVAQDATPLTPVSVVPYFYDVEGDTLTFSLDPATAPPWLTIDPVTGILSGTPPANASIGGPNLDGIYPVSIIATDNDNASVATVITYSIVNVPPVTVGPIDDFQHTVGEDFSTDVSSSFADPDGDTLSYTALGLPDGLTLDPVSGVLSGTLDPAAVINAPSGDGVYTVIVTADDGEGGMISTTFVFTALDVVLPDGDLPEPPESPEEETGDDPDAGFIDPVILQVLDDNSDDLSRFRSLLEVAGEAGQNGFDAENYLGGRQTFQTIAGTAEVQTLVYQDRLFLEINSDDAGNGWQLSNEQSGDGGNWFDYNNASLFVGMIEPGASQSRIVLENPQLGVVVTLLVDMNTGTFFVEEVTEASNSQGLQGFSAQLQKITDGLTAETTAFLETQD